MVGNHYKNYTLPAAETVLEVPFQAKGVKCNVRSINPSVPRSQLLARATATPNVGLTSDVEALRLRVG